MYISLQPADNPPGTSTQLTGTISMMHILLFPCSDSLFHYS